MRSVWIAGCTMPGCSRPAPLPPNPIGGGGIRVNGQPCRKPAQILRPGDTVTVSAHGRVRVLRMLQPGERRGPATEAATLYQEIEG